MPAKQQPGGTERDAQILRLATEVMKWKPLPLIGATFFPDAREYADELGKRHLLTAWNDDVHIHQVEGWDPFTSLADAWMLVEKLRERGLHATIDSYDEGWFVGFSELHKSVIRLKANKATVHEAICAAALAASQEKP